MASTLILITGVSGFIGFKTMILALEAGHQVRAVVRKAEQIPKLQTHPRILPHGKNLEFVVVPDLTESAAFDPILGSVSGILHLASPLAIETDEYGRDIIQPAIDVTNSVLEAASRHTSVKRVVITSSAVTLIPFEWLSNPSSDQIFTERDINSKPTGPFHSSMEAYWASKALSRIASHNFLKNHKPHFELINLLPTIVIGPDALAMSTVDLLSGTRVLAMAPILGQKIDMPLVGVQVHVDDVARAHIDALKGSVPGNADYVLTSDGVEGIEWNNGKDFLRGMKDAEMLKLGGIMPTMKFRIDASSSDRAFGWKCRGFEETIKDLVEQYLELLESEKSE